MKRRTLQQLIEQARRLRDDAATRMAGAHRDADKAQQTLDTLSAYLGEHLRRAATRSHADPVLLSLSERFTRKLDVAIVEQTGVRDTLDDATARRRSELIGHQRRLLAFETLQARRDAALAHRRGRAEQRQTDELAAQAASRRDDRDSR